MRTRTRSAEGSTEGDSQRQRASAAQAPAADVGNLQTQRALRSPGAPVDTAVRASVESVTGAPLDDVTVHTGGDAQALAAQFAARAVTVGREIHFGRGQYRPGTPAGDRLIAHELAHAGQQTRGGADAKLEAGPSDHPAEREADHVARASLEPGTPRRIPLRATRAGLARAPLADWGDSPQAELQGELKSELTIYDNAQKIIDWLRPRQPGPKLHPTDPVFEKELPDYHAPREPRPGPFPDAQPFTFTTAELLSDAALLKKLSAGASSVPAALQMLMDKGVILPYPMFLGGVFIVPVDPDAGTMLTTSFDGDRAAITAFSKKFDARVAANQPVVQTSLMKQSMSSDKKQMKDEADAQARVDQLQTQPPGPGRDAALAAAEKDLYIKQNYRRFSYEVLVWLNRLRKINTAWNAGTYPAHQWREFSVDIFPTDWSDKALLQLFDDINTASDDTSMDEMGLFAWRGIYNSQRIRDAVNAKMGDRYVGEAPGHEDHIHLNLKPLDLIKDSVTGFDIDKGRVVLD